jgi:hypothetical protein
MERALIPTLLPEVEGLNPSPSGRGVEGEGIPDDD